MKLMKILQEMKPKSGNLINANPDHFSRVLIKISNWDMAFKVLNLGVKPTDSSDEFYSIDLGDKSAYYYFGVTKTAILLNKKYAKRIYEHGGIFPEHEEEIVKRLESGEYIIIN